MTRRCSYQSGKKHDLRDPGNARVNVPSSIEGSHASDYRALSNPGKSIAQEGQTPRQPADLEAAIRAHGNFAEYVPLALLLIVFAEINRSPWWLVAIAALALVAGRYIHAMAIAGSDLKKRVLGMQLTFASMALGVVANVVPMVVAMINMPKS